MAWSGAVEVTKKMKECLGIGDGGGDDGGGDEPCGAGCETVEIG